MPEFQAILYESKNIASYQQVTQLVEGISHGKSHAVCFRNYH